MSDEETSEEVVVLKERFIPVSKDHFLSRLLDKFESDHQKQQFGQLCAAIETLFYVNRIAKLESFKQSYAPFSRLSEIKHKLSFKELEIRQTLLMKQIYDILNDAHFEAITFEMYKNSIEKVFLSDLPIKVDWPKLDSFLLTKFYEKYPSQNPYRNLKHKPPFYQHFAMFYRGYGLCVRKGLFFIPKLNLIFADLFPIIQSYISQFIAFMTATLFTKKKKKDNKNKNQSANDDIKGEIESPTFSQELDMLKLERISLLDTYNTAKSKGIRNSLWWLLKRIKIQEPTFKRLLMIYRQVPESFVEEQTRKMKERASKLKNKLEKTAKKKLGLKQDEKKRVIAGGVVDEIGRKRKASLFDTPDANKKVSKSLTDTYLYPIRIQYYNDIPMSDLEITYPCKQFSLKPMDEVYIYFTLFIGIWAIIKEFIFSTSTAFGYFMVIAAIFLMVRSIIWYRGTESQYVRVLSNALVESNISSDQDTMLSLVDSVDEQQFMETVLAYFVLLRNKDEIITDSDGVDRLCEKFMREEFGSDINVMIEGAMSKLTELGLFEMSGMSKDESIKVKALLDALSCVHQHYQSAIQTVRKITVNSIHLMSVEEENDDEKKDVVDTKKGDDKVVDDNGINKTPPIISSKQISEDHFNEDFTPID